MDLFNDTPNSLGSQLKKHQFKPGNSGNPKGRPKRLELKKILNNLLMEKREGLSDNDLVLIFKTQIDRAIVLGDTKAAQFVMDYFVGRPGTYNPEADDSTTLPPIRIEIVSNGSIPPPITEEPPYED